MHYFLHSSTTDLIRARTPGGVFHQLNMALLCSEILHTKTVHNWTETETKQLQNSCEAACFVSAPFQCAESL